MSRRIARVITRLNVGGPAYQAVLLSHLLSSRGYETLLIAGRCEPHEPPFDRLLREYPCEVVFCEHLRRSIHPVRDAAAMVEVRRILRRFGPDLVHTHTAKAGLVGRLAGREAGARRLVHTFHGHVLEGYFSPPVQWAVLKAERRLAKMTDRLVTISRRLAQDLEQRFALAPAQKIRVIELGLPLERLLSLPAGGPWRRRFGIGERAVVIGSLGRLVPVKNHARLIEAVASLGGLLAKRDVHVLIGGTGPLEAQLRRRIAELGLSSRVHLAGLVEDLPAFYREVDLAVLTSDNEGTPVTLLEAQAAGRYVIGPAVGGVPDVIGPATGRVVSPNTADAYAETLRELLERDALPAVGEADRRAVVERFSPERLVDDIDRLYRELLD